MLEPRTQARRTLMQLGQVHRRLHSCSSSSGLPVSAFATFFNFPSTTVRNNEATFEAIQGSHREPIPKIYSARPSLLGLLVSSCAE